jgi:hypothetical protein
MLCLSGVKARCSLPHSPRCLWQRRATLGSPERLHPKTCATTLGPASRPIRGFVFSSRQSYGRRVAEKLADGRFLPKSSRDGEMQSDKGGQRMFV